MSSPEANLNALTSDFNPSSLRGTALGRYELLVLIGNGGMASFQYTSSGRSDLEPFWPSRQHHDFDRVCCRAWNVQAL